MKNTPPSAQTEWERELEDYTGYFHRVDCSCVQENPDACNCDMFGLKDFIHKLLASERTRLLSVESMKMEELPDKGRMVDLDEIYYVNSLGPEDLQKYRRNELRQSILSEMEKGK